MKLIIFIIFIICILSLFDSDSIENFIYMPWNNSTRFYPTYDIRGYPNVYPPRMYLSPYNYTTTGDYITDLIRH